MSVRIYRPARSATQSGKAKTLAWLLEHDQEVARQIEPLMGWTSSADTRQQLKLWFATSQDAVAYAERNGLAYRVEEPKPVVRRSSVYSDNFRTARIGQWTH